MPLEYSHDSQPPPPDVLSPSDRLMIVSANVIDQKAERPGETDRSFYTATWNDVTSRHFRFHSETQISGRDSAKLLTMYSLAADASADTPAEFYYYDSESMQVQPTDDSWQRIHPSKSDDEYAAIVLGYLRAATEPLLTDDQEQMFSVIKRETNFKGAGFRAKIRRFGSAVVKGLGAVGNANG